MQVRAQVCRAPALAGLRVLVVDDDVDIADVVAMALADRGAVTATACSAADARAALAAGDFDLLISDISMPGETGNELVRGLRASADARLRELPAVAMTARHDARDRKEMTAAGFDSVVAKPFDTAELVDAAVALVQLDR